MKNQAPKPLLEYPKLGDWVSLNKEKKLVFFSGRVELGQGNITALTMMICDELGVQPGQVNLQTARTCLLYTSPSPRDLSTSRMPSSA